MTDVDIGDHATAHLYSSAVGHSPRGGVAPSAPATPNASAARTPAGTR